MGRVGHLFACASLAGVAAMTIASCREPTQMTLEIALDRRAKCSEISEGTAITVGVDPVDTEERVRGGFITAQTSACDEDGRIGTLVLTPADEMRASVIVVVGYGSDPTKCAPPNYAGCIVARRRFAFADHKPLRLPVTIDPDCANVPCGAFSSCYKGACYDSEVQCSGDSCEEPGTLPDGGSDPDSAVDGAVPGAASCEGETLRCYQGESQIACSAPCCLVAQRAVCDPAGGCGESPRYCCTDNDCGGGHCFRGDGNTKGLDAAMVEAGQIAEDASIAFDAGKDASSLSDSGTRPDASSTDAGHDVDSGIAPPDGGEPSKPRLGVCVR